MSNINFTLFMYLAGLRLNNLEVLDLSDNSLNNSAGILSCVDGFSSLKSLNLAYNGFNATSFHGDARYVLSFYDLL